METKVCRKCGIEKLITEYYRQSCGLKPLKHQCKTCDKTRIAAYNREHSEDRKKFYRRAPEPYKRRSLARYEVNKTVILAQQCTIRQRNRDYINLRKRGPCMDCGNTFPACAMDFDHVRGTKIFNLSKAAAGQVPLERIQAEIDKCDLVCANCHRVRSYTRKQHLTKVAAETV